MSCRIRSILVVLALLTAPGPAWVCGGPAERDMGYGGVERPMSTIDDSNIRVRHERPHSLCLTARRGRMDCGREHSWTREKHPKEMAVAWSGTILRC